MSENYAIVTHSFFAVTALVGSQLLAEWTLLKSGMTLMLFILYTVTEDQSDWIRKVQPLLRHVWLLAGHVLTFIVVQDALVRIQTELQHRTRDPSYGHVLSGLVVLILVLQLSRFNPIHSTHVLRTVLYTIALHFSGILLVLLEQPTTKAYTLAIVLSGCALFWLYWDRTHKPHMRNVYKALLTQMAVFFVARWFLFVYQLNTRYQHTHVLLSFIVIIAILVIFAVLWTRHMSILHTSTVHAIVEAFVFFLSFTFIPKETPTLSPMVTLVGIYGTLWFITRVCKRWLLKHTLEGTTWKHSLDYLLGLVMRVVTYVLIQLLIPFMRQRLNHGTRALEYVSMYLILILFASQFLWRAYVDERIDRGHKLNAVRQLGIRS